MPKQFTFVSGDIGGARAQLPVAKLLRSLGHEVAISADGAGKGIDVWTAEKFNFQVVNNADELHFEDIVAWSDLIFVSTCASASQLSQEMAKRCFARGVPVVMGADGFFNHGFPKWQKLLADYWFAINEAHAGSIRELRPLLAADHVKVVGQPAFDQILDLIPRKKEIRLGRRQQLGLDDEPAVLWWPTGMGELIEEDIRMATRAIEHLGQKIRGAVFMMNGCHPKLENVRKGYIADIIERISLCCSRNGVSYVNTQSLNIPLEELCLTADVILSITCTEDIKNTMMGGPPVVHLLGQLTRSWMEKELLLKPPHYLPDVISGESIAAFDTREIPGAINSSLNSATVRYLRANWQPPKEKATEKVAKELLLLAR